MKDSQRLWNTSANALHSIAASEAEVLVTGTQLFSGPPTKARQFAASQSSNIKVPGSYDKAAPQHKGFDKDLVR